jgi:hypothetical protein
MGKLWGEVSDISFRGQKEHNILEVFQNSPACPPNKINKKVNN